MIYSRPHPLIYYMYDQFRRKVFLGCRDRYYEDIQTTYIYLFQRQFIIHNS